MHARGRIGILVLAAFCLTSGRHPVAQSATPGSQAPKPCAIHGTVTAGSARIPAPGVVLLVTVAGSEIRVSSSSDLDGTFVLQVPGPGQYDLRAELAAFVPATKAVVVGADCDARVDLALSLASRERPAATPPGAPARTGNAPSSGAAGSAATPPRPAARPGAGAGNAASMISGILQRVAPVADAVAARQAQPAGGADSNDTVAAHLSLPPGFSADSLSQVVPAVGSAGQTNDAVLFSGRISDALNGQGGGAGAAANRPGGSGQAAGPLGQLGDLGSLRELASMAGINVNALNTPAGMLAAIGRLSSVVQSLTTRPHGMVTYDVGGSGLNANPYLLSQQGTPEPSYLQQHFGATLGGRLRIPNVFDAGPRTSFFFNYGGNRSSNLSTHTATVPTLAERSGDFSGVTDQLLDPLTHLPFAGNQIPLARMDAASLALLGAFPLPTDNSNPQNFSYSATTRTTSDDVNVRLIRNFGGGGGTRQPGGRQGGAAGRGGAAGGGRGGGAAGLGGLLGGLAGGGRGTVNLDIGLHYHRTIAEQANVFPTLGATSRQTGWDVPVNLNVTFHGFVHTLHAQFNRSTSQTLNTFAYVTDVSGNAGLSGIASDPFDWGLPGLSFSSISGLRDTTPSQRRDQTLTFGDSVVRTLGRHAIRFGGDFRDARVDSRSDANPNGAFVFTGLYTAGSSRVAGADVADFLLGVAQQASVQYGPGLEQFRTRSWSAYVQDDWRARTNLTFNLGLRYEFQSPYWEATGRLVNLDANANLTSVAPVLAGAVGPFTGAFGSTLVDPDRNNFAPRTGLAWRPRTNWMVRTGYGINYASVPYLSIVQHLAGQPPFATTNTLTGTSTDPLLLTEALATPVVDATTNNFGVDRTYRIGYVHIWNVDVQRDLGRTYTLGAAYIGTKGASLDLLRAPNRGPLGLRIDGVQPFTWESSGATSIMHSLSLRIGRRLAQGLSGLATYTLSRSRDDASSIGGAAAVVAQNDQNLAAEWGLSSFDQRHRFTGTFTWELPFGSGRRWMSSGKGEQILGGWLLAGTVSASSGTPYTARILADALDVARGTNGTLRADYTGASIAMADPTIAQFFNTAAFTRPAVGAFGDAARNTIIGPGSAIVNASLSRSLSFASLRGMSIRVQANNLLNSVQWSAIDTVVNSPSFGRVIGVRPMRSVQIVVRMMF